MPTRGRDVDIGGFREAETQWRHDSIGMDGPRSGLGCRALDGRRTRLPGSIGDSNDSRRDPDGHASRHTASLVEQNGLWVLWLLLVPVLLSGLALLTITFTDAGQARRRVLLWGASLALLGFCAVGIFSIGLFYLPSALALLCAALSGSVVPPAITDEPDGAKPS